LFVQPAIRYNLSLHKCFAKIPKEDPGQRGAFWFYSDGPGYFYEKGVLCKRKVLDDTLGHAKAQPLNLAHHPQLLRDDTDDQVIVVGGGEEGQDSEEEEEEEEADTEERQHLPPRTRKRRSSFHDEHTDPVLAKEPKIADVALSNDNNHHDDTEQETREKELAVQTLSTIGGGGSYKTANEDLELTEDLILDRPQPSDHQSQHDQAAGKPSPVAGKFSFAKVLAHAIGTSPEKKLTLGALYVWFTENYATHVASNESSWKGAIRHNLSYHPIFVKISRGDSDIGKGCYWGLGEPGTVAPSPSRARRPRYMKDFPKKEEGDSQLVDSSQDVTQDSSLDTSQDASVSLNDSFTASPAGKKKPPRSKRTAEEEDSSTAYSTLTSPQGSHDVETKGKDEATDNTVFTDDDLQKQQQQQVRPSIPGLPGFSPATLDFQSSHSSLEKGDSTLEASQSQTQSQSQSQSEHHQEVYEYHTNPAVRPPFSYPFLIAQAIVSHEHQRATLSEIISWIMRTYPHFRDKTEPWDVREIFELFFFFFLLFSLEIDAPISVDGLDRTQCEAFWPPRLPL